MSREWAKAMVAAEYLDYDPTADRYIMTDEQACVLANEDDQMFVGGALHFTTPTILNVQKIMDAFRNGGGISYSEIGEEIPEAIERFFRPGYVHSLARDWLSTVPGLTETLEKGINIADIGCGCGQSSVAMAKAFPKSKVLGIDYHGQSIDRARKLAAHNGLTNIEFLKASASEIPEKRYYELICTLDCIHDMADPLSALKSIREALTDGGTLFWSEPNASDNPIDCRNPVGKTFSSLSPFHCMTVSLAHGGRGLGTIIGESGARKLAGEAGFSHFEKLPIVNPLNQFFALRR
ncbi:MAG: class I SAM-dependent methyltransferase [Planctomycetes bacterium]|nr:class I SAM-dependent methyltransferase [Planctomycetota bacterium]